jgi:hypothetical protein
MAVKPELVGISMIPADQMVTVIPRPAPDQDSGDDASPSDPDSTSLADA